MIFEYSGMEDIDEFVKLMFDEYDGEAPHVLMTLRTLFINAAERQFLDKLRDTVIIRCKDCIYAKREGDSLYCSHPQDTPGGQNDLIKVSDYHFCGFAEEDEYTLKI